MSTESMTGRTTNARADSMVMQPYQPSRTALATRSASAAMRLSGSARSAALQAHFEQFAPSSVNRRVCPR